MQELFYFQIIIQGTRGTSWRGDIAIDNIQLNQGLCCKFCSSLSFYQDNIDHKTGDQTDMEKVQYEMYKN